MSDSTRYKTTSSARAKRLAGVIPSLVTLCFAVIAIGDALHPPQARERFGMLLFVLPMAVLTLFLTVVLPRGYVEFSSDTVVVQNSVRRFELPLASVEQFVRGESYRSAQLILVDNRWVYCHGVQPWLRYTDPGYMKVIDEMNTELAQRKARLVGEAAADPAR